MIDQEANASGQDISAPEEQQVETTERQQARDPAGRFAENPKNSGAGVTQQAEGEQQARQGDGKVPQQALHAARKKADEIERVANERVQRLEQELYQLRGFVSAQAARPQAEPQGQPQQPLPDWYTEPDKAFEARLNASLKPIQERLESAGASPRQAIESTSRMIAIDRHGQEAVQTAFQAADEAMRSNPATRAALQARFNASDHPFGELVKWHKEQAALSRVGDDPDAYIEAEVQRRLAEASGQELQPGGQNPPAAPAPRPAMPTNFATARNAGARTAPQWQGPKPLSEIYNGR